MSKIKIYCLKDPESSEVRYIGQTKRELYDRKKVHIYQSKKSTKPSKKEIWIKELLAKGLKPIIELIEIIDSSQWIEREQYWIAQFDNLTNTSIGGYSRTGTTLSDEAKKALRLSCIGNKHNLGKKWTEEQKQKRRQTPPWNKGQKGVIKKSDKFKQEASLRMKGQKHPMSKISDQDVLIMREKYQNGEKAINISREYKISYRHTLKIINNKIR